MKWPSSRKSLPKGIVSCTSTAWNTEWKRSSSHVDRTTKPHSSVSSSYMASGRTAPGADETNGVAPSAASVILAAANDFLVLRALGLHRRLQRAEEALRLPAVIGGKVADVDV